MFENSREERTASFDILKVLLSREVLLSMRDPVKAKVVQRAEMKIFQAEASAAQGDYNKFHALATEANEDLEDNFGKGAYISCFFIVVQADFELTFHRYRVAADLLEKAIAGFSKEGGSENNAVIFSCRGKLARCYSQLHLFDEAIEAYKQNLKLAPVLDKEQGSLSRVNYFDSLSSLARVYVQAGKKKECREALREAISLCDCLPGSNEKKAARYCRLAQVDVDLDDFDCAVALFDKAQKCDERSLEVYRERGIIYCNAKKYDQAVRDFTAGLAVDPGDANFLDWRSWTYEKQGGHQEQALKDLDSAIALARSDNEKNWMYCRKAILEANCGIFEGAVKDASEALKFSKKDRRSLLVRAESFGKLKQYDKAIADFSTLALDSRYMGLRDWGADNGQPGKGLIGTRVLNGRAASYLAMGKKDEASADLVMAKKMQKSYEEKLKAPPPKDDDAE